MAEIDAVGLDGTKGGWAVGCLTAGSFVRGYVAQSFREVVEAHPDATVAVDMPVGLEDAPFRKADEAARALLRGATSTVFNTPPRVVIEALERDAGLTYEDALAMAAAATGSGFSSQTWSIAPRILEIRRCQPFSQPVYEVHPEVSSESSTGLARSRGRRAGPGSARGSCSSPRRVSISRTAWDPWATARSMMCSTPSWRRGPRLGRPLAPTSFRTQRCHPSMGAGRITIWTRPRPNALATPRPAR